MTTTLDTYRLLGRWAAGFSPGARAMTFGTIGAGAPTSATPAVSSTPM